MERREENRRKAGGDNPQQQPSLRVTHGLNEPGMLPPDAL